MTRSALFSGAVAVMFSVWACGSGHGGAYDAGHNHDLHTEEAGSHGLTDPHDHGAEHGEAKEGHSDEIVIAPEKAAAAGIAVETVGPGEFSGVIRTGGQILPAPGDEKIIAAPADGIVAFSGDYFEGSTVDRAQPLFSILSGSIQDGNRLGKAKVAYETAASEYERAERLVRDRIIAQKDFVRIKENYENAKMVYEALKPNADGTGVSVEAPFKGHLRDIFVNEGDFVTVGTPLACAVRGERMTLRADVSQRYYGRLGEVVSANFIPQYSDSPLNVTALGGKLVSVGQSSAENAFYVPVTFEFDGVDGVIPGSFAEIWLLTAPRKNVISVPVSALTEEQGLYFVYLKMDESCYRKQEVALGESDGMRTEIISGLKAGDNVVVRGAYNVKLAGASNIIPAHTHNH